MQKLSNTIEKQILNTTSTELKYSKSQFDKDFPLLYIHEGFEHRRGVSCPIGYFDSEENRISKYKSDEERDKYYASPEWAIEYAKMQSERKANITLENISKEVESIQRDLNRFHLKPGKDKIELQTQLDWMRKTINELRN
jgi:hypothetical protein